MASDFWTSSWGRVIRQLGIYAAGVIPFVGAIASTVVKYADAQVFAVKAKKPAVAAPPAPARPTQAQARIIQGQDVLFQTRQEADPTYREGISGLPYFPDEPRMVVLPGTILPNKTGVTVPPATTNGGASSHGFSDLLQSVTGGQAPGIGFYFALGGVIVFALYLILSRRK